MIATTITIAQRKGGVGKSTSTLNLAHVFTEKGKKVLIIDLDDQQNTTRSISTLVESSKTIEDLLLNDDLTLNDVSVRTEWKNVSILASSSNLSGVVKSLDGELGGHLILTEKLRTNNDFDFILIDTSPSLNILVINALCASDYMFIPLSSKFFSMQGLKQTLNSFKKVESRLNPDLKLLGIAFVNHDRRNVLANEVVQQIQDKYQKELFKTIIGINIKIEEAQVKRESIINYAPNDRGSIQYRQLGAEILNKIYAEALQ
jgi:chromosome partitioning protein